MGRTLIHDVLAFGVDQNASDWHIKEDSPIMIRVAGKLTPTDMVPDNGNMRDIVGQLLNEELFQIFKRTGDADLSHVEDGVGRFRVNVHQQRGMMSINLRHVKSEIIPLDKLGVPPVLKDIAESHRGVIIMTGTTGSGKSTTLAGMLQHINMNFPKHVITIEDPIEYEFHDDKSFFEQREVGIDTESFYSALKHALRQDPDVIMVGEMRDRESFEAAMQAADTGHLVISTMHAANASQAVNRILDFFSHEEKEALRMALSLNLRSIISQRLIPKIGGGVVPACEVMINTPLIKSLLEKDDLDKLSQAVEAGGQDGMQSFNQCLLKLFNEGKIIESDALANASNPDALKMNLKGIYLSSSGSIVG